MNVTDSKSLIDSLANCQDYDTILVRKGEYSLTPLLPTPDTWTSNPWSGGAVLTLTGKKGVRIVGEESAVLRFTPGSGLCICNCVDIEVRGVTFEGPGYTLTPEKWYCAMILLSGTNARIHVHDCRFEDCPNHGIGHLMGGSTDDSIFESNTFLRGGHLNRPADIEGQLALGGDGAALAVRGSRNRYRLNAIIDWLRGIEIEPKMPDQYAVNNVIEDNQLKNVFSHGIFITPTNGIPDHCQKNIIRRNEIISGPDMYAWTMAHPIYVSGGFSQTVQDNVLYGELGDWCGIDASPNHCELGVTIFRNRVFGRFRFGIGVGFNGKPVAKAFVGISNNEIYGSLGAGIGYLGNNCIVDSNRIAAVVEKDGVCQPIYAPDDPQLSCCWDNQV